MKVSLLKIEMNIGKHVR